MEKYCKHNRAFSQKGKDKTLQGYDQDQILASLVIVVSNAHNSKCTFFHGRSICSVKHIAQMVKIKLYDHKSNNWSLPKQGTLTKFVLLAYLMQII